MIKTLDKTSHKDISNNFENMAGKRHLKRGRFLVPNEGLDYELLDLGNQRKLERFGNILVNRPEIQAKTNPNLSKKKWESAHFYFYEEEGKKGHWKSRFPSENQWNIPYATESFELEFKLELTGFKHLGIFPEQAANWHYIIKHIKRQTKLLREPPKFLNLFAYTGAASIVASKAGAEVTNVDSIKQVLSWGKENADLNAIDNIRWIHEDASKFVDKALRRGDKYHGIILDPPTYGVGAKNEKWKLEKDLKPLLERLMGLLEPKFHFFILNTYSNKLGMQELKSLLKSVKRFPKDFESSTLGLNSTSKQQLPLGNLIRFYK